MVSRIASAVLLTLVLNGPATAKDLRNAALHVLVEDLPRSGSSFSRDMLSRIATASGLEDQSVRAGLQILLDSLDHQRQRRTNVWKTLTSLGGDDVNEKKMDRLLREFIGWGLKVTEENGNYGLKLMVERSAKKAKVPARRAQDLLAAATSLGVTGEIAPGNDLPAKIGILVAGENTYRVDAYRFRFILMEVNEDTRFHDIHFPVVTGLLSALPELESVRWATDGPHPRLEADCILQVDVTDFFSSSVPPRNTTLHATVRIALSTSANVLLYSRSLEVAYDVWLEPDYGTAPPTGTVRNQRSLDIFLLKITAAVRDDIGRYLERSVR